MITLAGSAAMITGLAIGSGFNDSVYEKLPGDITFGYQYLATLNASIEGTQNLYVTGNADGIFGTQRELEYCRSE